MSKFRKKPIVIEAVQWKGNLSCLVELQPFYCSVEVVPNFANDGLTKLAIQTLEGEMVANHGDWVIKGAKGELYPCKPDIFEETHEPV